MAEQRSWKKVDGPLYFSIDKQVSRLLERARDAVADRVLRDYTTKVQILVGEVIQVRRRERRIHLRMRATDDPEVAFNASLPSTTLPEPQKGDMLRIEGSFRAVTTSCGVDLRFEGQRYAGEPTKASRYRTWLLAYESIKERLPPAVWPERPIERIGVLTGKWTHGWYDFLAGLGAIYRRKEVDVELLEIPLETGTAEDTAKAIAAVLDMGRHFDLLAVVRGGGDTEKLQRFSDPVVVEAVATVASVVPTIVAIGHDQDDIAAEEFGFEPAPAPSAAGRQAARHVLAMRKRFETEAKAAPLRPPVRSHGDVTSAAFSKPLIVVQPAITRTPTLSAATMAAAHSVPVPTVPAPRWGWRPKLLVSVALIAALATVAYFTVVFLDGRVSKSSPGPTPSAPILVEQGAKPTQTHGDAGPAKGINREKSRRGRPVHVGDLAPR